MSSAAKLRNVRRGTVAVAAAAAVMTAFGPVAYASWDDAPQTAANEQPAGPGDVQPNVGAGNNGTIGVVDTAAYDNSTPAKILETTGNQGATLVQPGKDGQAIGGLRFTIPNRWVSGDVIELRLLDRGATAASDGMANSGPDYKMGFSADPKVAVSAPQAASTLVTSDTNGLNGTGLPPAGNQTQNTETLPDNPWVASGSLVQPGVAPSMGVSRLQSKGAQGYDIIRLTMNGNPSTGDPNAKWVVTLSDLKVDLGKSVTPGALRVVPFAMSKATSGVSYSNSSWFYDNRTPNTLVAVGDPTFTATRIVNIYTVPAWVSPVTVSVATPDVVADGLPQNIGDVTMVESNPASIGDGNYVLTIGGANVASAVADLKFTITGGGATESATVTAVGANTVSFTVANSSLTTAATYKLSGLRLTSNTPGPLTYKITGGTISSFLASPAGTGAAIGTIPAEAALCTNGNVALAAAAPTVTQNSTVAMTGTTQLGDATYTFATNGANLELRTAGAVVVATAPTGSTVFPLSAPFAGTLTFSIAPVAGSTVTVAGSVASNGSVGALAVTLPAGSFLGNGVYNFNLNGTTLELRNAANAVIGADAAAPFQTFVLALAPFTGNVTTAAAAVTTETFTISGGVATTNVTGASPVQVNAPSTLAAGAYTVTFNPGTNLWELNTGGAPIEGTSVNGTEFTLTGAAGGGTVYLSQAFGTGGGTITINAAAVAAPQNICVNQDDIISPLDKLTQLGTSKSNSDRIGGNDRYSTAAKIAAQWTNSEPGSGTDDAFGGGRARNVILVSGTSYPDALSASYMSSRLMAPILLTGANELPAQTIEALRDRFVEKVYIIGGTGAVSGGVEAALKDLNQYVPDSLPDPANPGQWLFRNPKPTGAKLQVQRLGGSDRYTTNQLANMYAAAWGGGLTVGKTVNKFGEAGKYTAILARGDAFPDALVGGILTVGYGAGGNTNANALPLVLTTPTEFAAPAKALFANLDIQHAILVGGTGALSDGVETAVKAAGATTNRLAGPDRYATAAEVNKFALKSAVGSATNPNPGLGFDVGAANDTVYLATGSNFPDALAAAPFVGWSMDTMALVVVNEIPAPTKTFLNDYAAILDKATGLGLGGVVSAAVVQEANAIVSTK